MEQSKELGAFLRSRRARLRPTDLGLAVGERGPRRVPGLRRDEVARLAGISTEYYTRIEQGRGGNVSTDVLDALARTLHLDTTEREHLIDLATVSVRRRVRLPPQQVRAGLRQLLDTLDHVPAFIVGRRTEVLASNQLARAVLADFGARPGAGCNFARFVLAEPVARELFVDWETAARDAVAILRMEAGRRPTDRQLADLVGELREQCPEFAAWWDDRGVLNRTHGVKLLHNPTVGDLTFSYEVFPAPADPDRSLCIYSVEPGSPSEQALRLLASWAATPQHDTSAVES